MAGRLKALTLSFAALCVVGVIGAYATYASAEPSTAEYAAYHNDRWRFSLAVPAGMTVGVHDQAGGGQTIQFLDAEGAFQFQVSTLPYSQLDLALNRTGAPSGTNDQPDHLEIVDVVRDDTFTVLFQKNGVRYAVVTLPAHEAGLTDILKSWHFTD